MSSETSTTQTGPPMASNIEQISQENNAEPSPFEIVLMSVEQKQSLLLKRAERDNSYKWTYIETSVWPPGGFEIHYDPQRRALRFVQRLVQPTSLPLHDRETTGYDMYQAQYVASGCNLLSKEEWNKSRDMCIKCINAVIKDNHGIVYKLKRGVDSGLDVTVFHICDYITMLQFSTICAADSRVAVQTKYKPSNAIEPALDFPKSVKNFIHTNADYFFLCYGIWGNHSELPIVLVPPLETMQQANNVMNIDEFVAVQFGKQQALRFCFSDVHENNLKFRNLP